MRILTLDPLSLLLAAGFAEEDLCEDVRVADGLGSAGEDDAASIQDVGAVDDVEYVFNIVLKDHNGGLEPLASRGDLRKCPSGHADCDHVRPSRSGT